MQTADKVTLIENGPVRSVIRIEKSFLSYAKRHNSPTYAFPSSFFIQDIILTAGVPRVDIRMQIEWWEEHKLLKVAFPVSVENKNATYEIPYAAIERPTTMNNNWEKARFEVSAQKWADLSDDSYGISLLNESKYGYDIHDNVMRLTLLRSPLSPDPTADRGKHDFKYALYPHRGDWREGNSVRRGYEFNYPLEGVFALEHEGSLPSEFSLFESETENIIISAFKKAEDSNGIILRYYETFGKEVDAKIKFASHPKRISEVDLLEKNPKPVNFEDNTVLLPTGHFEIKSLLLEW